MFFKRYFSSLKDFDWILFGAVFLLICFGLAALYSIAISSETPNFLNFKKQLIFALIGLIILFFISLIDYRSWQDYSYLIYFVAALFLFIVLFVGKTIRGTTGWFSLGWFNFQPVEVAKISLICFLSWFLGKSFGYIKLFKNFLISAVITGLMFILVVLQPDFGSSVILFSVWILMIIFAGVRQKHLLFLFFSLLIVGVITWVFLFQTYQKDRILTFLNPNLDPYGRGYHVRQAVTAVGAGGFLGQGLGFGSQSQLKFIPASQTDFIFAVIGEELGFLGVILILFFWAVIFYRLIKTANVMKDNFSYLFILGVSGLFFTQVFINIGMNIGLVPVTGISLPFCSYGGSFLVASLILVGVVESMIIKNKA